MKFHWSFKNIVILLLVLALTLVAIYLIINVLLGPEDVFPTDHPYAGPIPSDALARLGKGRITQIALSSDGKDMAVGSAIGIYVYSLPSMEFMWYGRTEGPIYNIDYSRNSDLIATATDDAIILWEPKTGEQLRTLPLDDMNIVSLKIAPDGSTLATASIDYTISEWDLQSGDKIQILEDLPASPTSLSYSPDGKTLVAGIYDGSIIVWDRTKGEQVAGMDGSRTSVYGVADVEFSQDGSKLVSGSYDGYVILWETSEWRILNTFDASDQLIDVAFSPDGKVLVTTSWTDNLEAATVWDLGTGSPLLEFGAEEASIKHITFLPKGEMLVAWGYNGEIALYSTQTWKILKRVSGFTSLLNGMACSPDETILATSYWGGQIVLWDTRNWDQVSTLSHQDKSVSSLVFSPDGFILASSYYAKDPYSPQDVDLWDVRSGEFLRDLQRHSDSINDLAFSPDGTTIASASDDGAVIVWNTEDGLILKEILAGEVNPTMKTVVKSISFHPQGDRIAACYGDGTVILWDIASGERNLELPGDTWDCALTFSPDGETLAASSEVGVVNLFNTGSGEKLGVLALSLDETTTWEIAKQLAYSPDGSLLAVGMSDGRIILFETFKGERLRVLNGHTMYVTALAFSQNGRRLISGSDDGTVLFWNIES
jgi:WD40 repeat protein